MTVQEVSRLTGVTVRTLHHYDAVGLLRPGRRQENGYRVYDEKDLERLQMILMYRTLEFSLKDIRRILDSPDYDRNRALEQQIELLALRKKHLENLIAFARGICVLGVNNMDFSAFDTRKLDEYTEQAKALWGNTPQWKEQEEKEKGRSAADQERLKEEMMSIFREFGELLRHEPPESTAAQAMVEKLRSYMTEHFYNCTPQILRGLGNMYAAGGDFTENIDAHGGRGTAEFVHQAIDVYCDRNK